MTAAASETYTSLDRYIDQHDENQHNADLHTFCCDHMTTINTVDFSNANDGNKQKPFSLSDGSNIEDQNRNACVYINKLRRDSVTMKEHRKVHLVRVRRTPGTKVEKKCCSLPVPLPDVPNVSESSPIDAESQMRLRSRKRHGVASDYAQEVIDYLQMVEQRYSIPQNYLSQQGSDVSPDMRTKLVDWLIQVQVYYGLSQHTLHLCVNLLDKFLSIQSVQTDIIQLVGITCLLLASKYHHDRTPPEIDDLCYLTDDTYKPGQVLKMEHFILKKLNFDLNVPEHVTFLKHFLMIHTCEEENSSHIQYMSMYLVDLTLTEMQFVHFNPSLVSASAIYVARQLLGCDVSWDNTFQYYTNYPETELFECSQCIKRCLAKLNKSKYTAAKEKYALPYYDSISTHSVLNPTQL